MPDLAQGQIADRIGMTADALSRALNGKRAFSAIELAQLADLLDVDIHELITGEPDPKRVVFAARHAYDFATGARDVPGHADDAATLEDIKLAYRQAGEIRPSLELPRSPDGIRSALGPDFIRPFAERLERFFEVDVIRVAELSTAYCFTYLGRHVIVIPAVGNWFRENWDIAHELGHLTARPLIDGVVTAAQEGAANAFAAELLLPAAGIRRIDWQNITDRDLAGLVWERGVSTKALAKRLASLGLQSSAVERWAPQATQRLLRHHWDSPEGSLVDEITRRTELASTRRFPLTLESSHLRRIETGEIGKATLAWMLGIRPDALDVDTPPEPSDVDTTELANELGLSTS
ncbi:MAG: hypothetical protein ABS81_10505 [Pseudonocardia sp. SCN 72-86]|nr:MAG: hypothetical protein ABS81_10505 [Pseudonocardia sp. SCN 72-86]